MSSITGDAVQGSPAPGFRLRWKSEWTSYLAKLVIGGLVAGGSASLGFWSTWQTLQADVRQTKADVVSLHAVDAQQASDLAKLEARQNDDDKVHAAEAERNTAIQRSLDQLREDIRDFRRDLTGRVGR